ncbi:unnamed protein product [Rotaria sp. Silwood1]|nr:unnamed protein product [Rotaria sp. Silwood1]CAF1627557.1 unnamed protein product [Rotaria sp. Silwood1]CAF3638798.1 unnamed protein product [Rotaria sp. Silwood1]CAF4556410.1 unnamed protein product [Rotaria sp. Silwood1]
MQVWLEIATSASNNSWSIIFEDDIDLEMATSEVMESFPRDLWNKPDMIYLGHCSNPAGPIMYEGIYGYRVHKALNPLCTHAYAIRSNAARKLIRLLATPQRGIDRDIVNQINAGEILAFSIHPPLVVQRPISSLNPSDVQVQNKNSLSFRIEKWLFSLSKWWRGVKDLNTLRNSTWVTIDSNKVDH